MKVKLEPYGRMPTRAHPNDAGLDLYAPYNIRLRWLRPQIVKTGVHIWELNSVLHNAGFIKNRSSMLGRGIITDGTIDDGYTGEIGVILISLRPFARKIRKGERIAQLVITPIIIPPLEQVSIVEELEATERGENGFGSTGR